MKIFSLPLSQSHPLSSLLSTGTAGLETISRKGRQLLALLPDRRQLGIIAGLGVLAFLTTGAVQVSHEMRNRPRKAQLALRQTESWSQDITATLPLQHRDGWESLAKQDPGLIIDICTVSLPPSR